MIFIKCIYYTCLHVFYMYLFNYSLEASPLLLISWLVASVSINNFLPYKFLTKSRKIRLYVVFFPII